MHYVSFFFKCLFFFLVFFLSVANSEEEWTIDKFNDLDSLAALISSCDFIITISNVTAHFAGALGIKTFLLVPYGAGRIWYWSDESFSKWYPSIQILKQDNPSSWDLVFGKLENELLEIERINS